MSLDLDPNYSLPLWQALVRYFRAFPPLVQGHGRGPDDAAAPEPQPTPPQPDREEIARPQTRRVRAGVGARMHQPGREARP